MVTGKKDISSFRLVSGAISKKAHPKMQVNLKRFGRLIEQCQRRHDHKREFARVDDAQQGLTSAL